MLRRRFCVRTALFGEFRRHQAITFVMYPRRAVSDAAPVRSRKAEINACDQDLRETSNEQR
jgi:hypothetical protein